MAHAEVPTSTNALATPARKRDASHSGGELESPIESVSKPTATSPAHRGQGAWLHRNASERTKKVSKIVAGREPAAHRQRQGGILLHQRQDRRQRKPPDSHRACKRHQPDCGGGHGGRLKSC